MKAVEIKGAKIECERQSVQNVEKQERCGIKSYGEEIDARMLRWYDHSKTMDSIRTVKRIYNSDKGGDGRRE